MTRQAVLRQLYDIGAVKLDFRKGWTLKDGSWTPIYIDFRVLQSKPKLLSVITELLVAEVKKQRLKYDLVASIPLGGIPLGIAYALKTGIPHIMPRMDNKTHGAVGVRINGIFRKGQHVLLIDDLITAARSKIEAIDELNKAGLRMRDVLVILDRQQGGREQLASRGYVLHSVFTLDELFDALVRAKKMTKAQKEKIIDALSKAGYVRH
jgi:orotate phosphoribosyltransferase